MNSQPLSEYAKNLLDRQAFVEEGLKEFGAIIAKAERGAYGLTLDSAKTPEWKEAKRQHSIYWNAYRRINGQLAKIRKAVGREVVNGKLVTIYQYKD
jgi:hypothetical protein